MRVIGTAGHVDHGKSTLIQALTGTHPDRLAEEIAREMTIDLGFAWWQLPSGEEVGVIDVPGHIDFIENMLSGIGGIDAVVFVIAADEGVMPQTIEHLTILNILDIKSGVIALTKIDMVNDEEWLSLVQQEILETMKGTVLENAKIIPVSALTGVGIELLQSEIESLLQHTVKKKDLNRPRLPIDRVFTMPGYGTVVTGTLIDGKFNVGDEIKVSPSGVKGRIRGIQNHKKASDVAFPGARTAINISGIKVEQIERGQVLTSPEINLSTSRLDLSFQAAPSLVSSLKHNMTVKFFSGASEVVGRIRLIGIDEINPSQQAWLQIYLNAPVAVARGDRYILRRPSPGETIGGGEVLDTQPQKRHKRFEKITIRHFETLAEGSPKERILQELERMTIASPQKLQEMTNFPSDEFQTIIDELISQNSIRIIGGESLSAKGTILIMTSTWVEYSEKLSDGVQDFHQNNPLQVGIPKEVLKGKLNIDNTVFNLLVKYLIKNEEVAQTDHLIHFANYQIKFSPQQLKSKQNYLNKLLENPFSPPVVKDSIGLLGDDLFYALVSTGVLRQISENIVFDENTYQTAIKDILQFIEKFGNVSLGQMRDHWGTSRKYVQPLLEYMDSQKITKREGDGRVKY